MNIERGLALSTRVDLAQRSRSIFICSIFVCSIFFLTVIIKNILYLPITIRINDIL